MVTKAKQAPESIVLEIKSNTRRKFNSEEKSRLILEGLQGKDSYLDNSKCLSSTCCNAIIE
jgi:hypothetical protein